MKVEVRLEDRNNWYLNRKCKEREIGNIDLMEPINKFMDHFPRKIFRSLITDDTQSIKLEVEEMANQLSKPTQVRRGEIFNKICKRSEPVRKTFVYPYCRHEETCFFCPVYKSIVCQLADYRLFRDFYALPRMFYKGDPKLKNRGDAMDKDDCKVTVIDETHDAIDPVDKHKDKKQKGDRKKKQIVKKKHEDDPGKEDETEEDDLFVEEDDESRSEDDCKVTVIDEGHVGIDFVDKHEDKKQKGDREKRQLVRKKDKDFEKKDETGEDDEYRDEDDCKVTVIDEVHTGIDFVDKHGGKIQKRDRKKIRTEKKKDEEDFGKEDDFAMEEDDESRNEDDCKVTVIDETHEGINFDEANNKKVPQKDDHDVKSKKRSKNEEKDIGIHKIEKNNDVEIKEIIQLFSQYKDEANVFRVGQSAFRVGERKMSKKEELF